MGKEVTPTWVGVTIEDIKQFEGFREYAYPDPLSPLHKTYRSAGWGFKPATTIFRSLPSSALKLSGTPWTVGYGTTGRDVGIQTKVTREWANARVTEDTFESIRAARRICAAFDDLSGARKSVLVNMVYQMGEEGVSKFHSTLNAINSGDYKAASLHMLQSKWATQTPSRVRKLAQRMAQGEF